MSFSTSGRFDQQDNAQTLTWCSLLAVLLAVLVVLSFTGCVNIDELREDAEVFAELNRKHERDAALPLAARQIAQDNADAWEVQAWELGGREPHQDVLVRIGVAPVDSAR